jgi:hypothetical protein
MTLARQGNVGNVMGVNPMSLHRASMKEGHA